MSKATLGLTRYMAGLSSVLVDITTDYLGPAVERLGLPRQEILALQAGFRPEVQFLGNDVLGLVAADLDEVMHDILSTVRRAGGDVRGLTQFLCCVCQGSDGWATHTLQDWAEAGIALQGMSFVGLPDAAASSFEEYVTKPRSFILDYEAKREEAWMRGPRSDWDQVAYERIFGELGVPPSLQTAFERKCVRDFAADLATKLDAATFRSLHGAAQSALVEAGNEEGARTLLPLSVVNERTVADWRAVVGRLQATGFEWAR